MIGGVGGFSTLRQRPEIVTTILVTILFAGFSFKNLGAIVATAEERQAILLAIKGYPAAGPNAADINRVRDKLEPKMPEYDVGGAQYFHVACALLTIAFVWAKEWQRRKTAEQSAHRTRKEALSWRVRADSSCCTGWKRSKS